MLVVRFGNVEDIRNKLARMLGTEYVMASNGSDDAHLNKNDKSGVKLEGALEASLMSNARTVARLSLLSEP